MIPYPIIELVRMLASDPVARPPRQWEDLQADFAAGVEIGTEASPAFVRSPKNHSRCSRGVV